MDEVKQMDPKNIQVGDTVADSPVGEGTVTGFTADGYPEVDGKAVGHFRRTDGAMFGAFGVLNTPKRKVDQNDADPSTRVAPMGLQSFGMGDASGTDTGHASTATAPASAPAAAQGGEGSDKPAESAPAPAAGLPGGLPSDGLPVLTEKVEQPKSTGGTVAAAFGKSSKTGKSSAQ